MINTDCRHAFFSNIHTLLTNVLFIAEETSKTMWYPRKVLVTTEMFVGKSVVVSLNPPTLLIC